MMKRAFLIVFGLCALVIDLAFMGVCLLIAGGVQ